MIGRLERLRTVLGAMGVFCLIFGLWVLFRVFLLGFILMLGGTLFIVVSRGLKELAMDLLADSIPVDIEKAKWPRQIVGSTIIGLAILLSSLYTHSSDVLFLPWLIIYFFASFFFTGFGNVIGVWFGAWGIAVIASLAFIPEFYWPSSFHPIGILFQTLIPALAFKRFNVDPRIRTSRDASLFVGFSVILGSLLSALVTPPLLYAFSYYDSYVSVESLIIYLMPNWFFSHAITSLFFGLPMFKIGSRIAISVRAYCKGWFS